MTIRQIIAALLAGGVCALLWLRDSTAPEAPPAEDPAPAGAAKANARQGEGSIPPRKTMTRDAAPDVADSSPGERSVEELRLEAELLKGQLENITGKPIAWPAGLHPSYAPGAYAANAAILAQEIPGGQLKQVDCNEYPCIAYVDVPGDPSALPEQIFGQVAALWGPDASASMSGKTTGQGDSMVTTMAFAVSPTSDEELRARVDWRTKEAFAELVPDRDG